VNDISKCVTDYQSPRVAFRRLFSYWKTFQCQYPENHSVYRNINYSERQFCLD